MLDTTLSLVAPFIAYLAAEAVDGSGVLSVVIVGLILGHKAPALQSASSRLAEQVNWRTITFVLENAVFLLIGLQVAQVVRDATSGDFGVRRLILICGMVLLATLVTASSGCSRRRRRTGSVRQMRERSWPWSYATS